MGGKAFPLLQTIRLNKSQYDAVASSCLEKLNTAFPDGEFRIIESYREKETFGDLDILWCGAAASATEIRDTLKAIDHQPNGPVTSFAVPISSDSIFQVDLIRVDCKHLESAASYFAFNDLGNLLGRIFHRAGFKLGHKGMLFVVREEGNSSHAIKEIEVTCSWKEALEFAGYDFNRWLEGFKELEDVFRFVVSSPYFDKRLFALNSLD